MSNGRAESILIEGIMSSSSAGRHPLSDYYSF
jgi:hypothetical protein